MLEESGMKEQENKPGNQSSYARANHEKTKKLAGYVPRKNSTQETYDRIGFMSGLEVHQQLKTKEKLFCHCPAGIYNESDDYDAEVIRHMRPTLSELGEYDGTALMEFKTRKEIIYRIKNETACTYEVDDTPPFPLNREALGIAIEISLLSKLNVVGEVHITRKQYLDGSIPTGFQRTGIIGVEGELQLKNKKIRLIQLSLEEDSCREISDIGHVRTYKTDRLGMPLIETVTYPDCMNPDEVKEACDYIRFLNRSTGKVRTGMGAGRQDVNVSCRGGTRVEIKGVAHTKWIPELTHNECFRQWSLLLIRDELNKRIKEVSDWKMKTVPLNNNSFVSGYEPIKQARKQKLSFVAVNLPGFRGILSHFTQPGKCFADEISDRLKVIACIEKPHMAHSEDIEQLIPEKEFDQIRKLLGAKENDAQIVFWGPEEDIKTAIETIEERCHMAFEGVPNETRKSFPDGTTIFERVLPGADRMYPDTDTAPIPLEEEYIENLRKSVPEYVSERIRKMIDWGIPEDTYTYILRNNIYPVIEKIVEELDYDPKFIGTFFGHRMKFVEGHYKPAARFKYKLVYKLFEFLKKNNIEKEIAVNMLPHLYEHPKMDFDSILDTIGFSKNGEKELTAKIPFLVKKFEEIKINGGNENARDWIMGELRKKAIGNLSLTKLSREVEKSIG